MRLQTAAVLGCWLAIVSAAPAADTDPLPSWHDGATKQAIMAFVAAVSAEGGADFVPQDDRIAVFDNDGTLWAENPIYFQLAFAIDRVEAMAADHPKWKETEPFRSILVGDTKNALAGGKEALGQLVMATHAGMTSDEFAAATRSWVDSAQHPRFDRPYTECVYQPMLELLVYLRANGFATYIVSGGGVAFMRVFAEEVYGVPPEQVIGSRVATAYEVRDGKPVIVRQAKLAFIDDKEGKPVGIHGHIGRRPIAAFGNSDGDFQMLEWTTAGSGRRLGVLVHHDDATREWAYDRDSHIGQLARGLDEAPERGWTVVSMKNDWRQIFPSAD